MTWNGAYWFSTNWDANYFSNGGGEEDATFPVDLGVALAFSVPLRNYLINTRQTSVVDPLRNTSENLRSATTLSRRVTHEHTN